MVKRKSCHAEDVVIDGEIAFMWRERCSRWAGVLVGAVMLLMVGCQGRAIKGGHPEHVARPTHEVRRARRAEEAKARRRSQVIAATPPVEGSEAANVVVSRMGDSKSLIVSRRPVVQAESVMETAAAPVRAEREAVMEQAWGDLDMGRVRVAGVTVFYEKALAEKIGAFEKVYEECVSESEQNRKILGYKEQLITHIGIIVGVKSPQLQERQREVWGQFTGAALVWRGPFYVFRKKTVKSFLRGGGELPDMSYDARSNEVHFHSGVMIADAAGTVTSRRGRQNKLAMVVPVQSAATFERDVRGHLRSLDRIINTGVLLHEMVELGLMERLRPGDPYYRWFSDGFANAIAIKLLARYIGPGDAEEFGELYDSGKYWLWRRDTNLRYWMLPSFCVNSPVDYENRLRTWRYAFATAEAQRVIKEYGIGSVKAILDWYEAQGGGSSEALVKAVAAVTGEDTAARLRRHQGFTGAYDGIREYYRLLGQAEKTGEHKKMFRILGRLLELRGDQFSQRALTERRKMIELLIKMGHEEYAVEAIEDMRQICRMTGDATIEAMWEKQVGRMYNEKQYRKIKN